MRAASRDGGTASSVPAGRMKNGASMKARSPEAPRIVRATVPSQLVDRSVDILNQAGTVEIDRTARSETARSEKGGPVQVVEEDLHVGTRAGAESASTAML